MVGPALEAVQGKEEGDYKSLHCKISRDSGLVGEPIYHMVTYRAL